MSPLQSSSPPSLLSKNPNAQTPLPFFPKSHSLSFSLLTNLPTFSSLRFHSTTLSKPLSAAASSQDNFTGDSPPEITDEWGEKSGPEIETPTKLPAVDPPKDEDEWGGGGVAVGAATVGVVADEWGERGETEIEPPSSKLPDVDPPKDEDEWGERGGREIEMPSSSLPDADQKKGDDDLGGVGVNGSAVEVAAEEEGTAEEKDEMEDLKRRLVDMVYGTDFGFRASTETRAEVLELVTSGGARNQSRRGPNYERNLGSVIVKTKSS